MLPPDVMVLVLTAVVLLAAQWLAFGPMAIVVAICQALAGSLYQPRNERMARWQRRARIGLAASCTMAAIALLAGYLYSPATAVAIGVMAAITALGASFCGRRAELEFRAWSEANED